MGADSIDAREKIWTDTRGIIGIDPKGKKGHELSEIKAHLFIEKFGGAATWTKFRDIMRQIDKDFNNRMSLTEYFIFHYKLDWKELVKREQVTERRRRRLLTRQMRRSSKPMKRCWQLKKRLMKARQHNWRPKKLWQNRSKRRRRSALALL